MHLNMEQLRSFVMLVQTGSVGGAARARCLTQSAVSNHLKRLQDQIGLPLYQRQGRGVALTRNGELFYRYALNVVHSMHEAEAFADGLHQHTTGRVTIIASQTIAGALLPSALVAFRQQEAGIEVFIDSANSQQVFERIGNYDLGLVEMPVAAAVPECCQVTLLGCDKIVVVMRHDHVLAGCSAISPEQLSGQPLIWREEGSGTRAVLEQMFMTTLGYRPEIRMCIGGVAAMLEAVRQGLGIGVASRLCLPAEEKTLIMRALQPQMERPMSLLLPGHASAVARKTSEFLVAYLKNRLDDFQAT